MSNRLQKHDEVFNVGSVYTDGGVVVIGTFFVEEDADKLFTRLQDRRFPGDGIKEHFITYSPLYVRKMD